MVRQRALVVALAAGMLMVPVAASTAVAQQSATLNLAPGSDSGITGTATITQTTPNRLRVEIRATGAGAGPQAAHIHQGSCAQLNPAPVFSLATVANGASTTEVDGTLQQLTASPHAIHMHRSADELAVNVACADVQMGGQAGAGRQAGMAGQPGSLPRSGDAASLTGLVAGFSGAGIAMVSAGYALWRRPRRR